jgi:hypothetical protein
MLKRDNDLIIGRGLSAEIGDHSPSILLDFNTFLHAIQPGGILPVNPPFEVHPYLDDFPLQNFDKYVIGTFPPISYACDKANPGLQNLVQPTGGNIARPYVPFFHGNQFSMWNFILNDQELETFENILDANGREQAKTFLINFLTRVEINYSDIIKSAQRKLVDNKYNAEDKNLWNISINNTLINHLLSNEGARYLLFNTGSTFGNNGLNIHQNRNAYGLPGQLNVRQETNSFDLFIRGCQEMGLQIDFRISQGIQQFEWTELNGANTITLQHNLKTKIAFEARIRSNAIERVFTIITPFSPAAVNRGNTALNSIVSIWLAQHPDQSPADLLHYIYHDFRNGLAENLYQLNR